MAEWLDRLRQEIEQATRGLSEAEWRRAPQGQWNTAQILEHLGRTYTGTAKMLEQNLRASDSPIPGLRPASFRERLYQFSIVRLGRFPTGRNAPEVIAPRGDPGPEVLPKVLGGLQRMREALDAAEERWGGKSAVAVHFALGPMSARQWRKFHYLHGQHHLRQVRQRLGDRAAS